MNKPHKRIAILIDRLNVGGVEKIAIEEIRALREENEDAYLVILRRKDLIKNAFADLRRGIPTIYLDDRLPWFLKFSFKFPIFHFFSLFHITYPFLLPFVIKENEFDYIISHGTYTCFTAVAINKVKKIPFAAFIWDPIYYILTRVYSNDFNSFVFIILQNIGKFLDSLITKNANYVLVGGNVHNDYLESIGARIKIIPPSVHPSSKIVTKRSDAIMIVTAWKRGKHPEYLVKLIKKIPTLKIDMVGRWGEEQYLQEFKNLIKKENVEKNINIVGAVTESELFNYYKNAPFILQTNDDRGFGMPPLEAAGSGTTFIIPKDQGVCALFEDKIDGFYTKEYDTKMIVEYIELLLNNKALAMKMARHAWEKVKKNYSWDNHAKQLIDIVYLPHK